MRARAEKAISSDSDNITLWRRRKQREWKKITNIIEHCTAWGCVISLPLCPDFSRSEYLIMHRLLCCCEVLTLVTIFSRHFSYLLSHLLMGRLCSNQWDNALFCVITGPWISLNWGLCSIYSYKLVENVKLHIYKSHSGGAHTLTKGPPVSLNENQWILWIILQFLWNPSSGVCVILLWNKQNKQPNKQLANWPTNRQGWKHTVTSSAKMTS